jgi:hypothetical protein
MNIEEQGNEVTRADFLGLTPEDEAVINAQLDKRIVRGEGRLSGITFGVGKPKVTNVVGASPLSCDWNLPKD